MGDTLKYITILQQSSTMHGKKNIYHNRVTHLHDWSWLVFNADAKKTRSFWKHKF